MVRIQCTTLFMLIKCLINHIVVTSCRSRGTQFEEDLFNTMKVHRLFCVFTSKLQRQPPLICSTKNPSPSEVKASDVNARTLLSSKSASFFIYYLSFCAKTNPKPKILLYKQLKHKFHNELCMVLMKTALHYSKGGYSLSLSLYHL